MESFTVVSFHLRDQDFTKTFYFSSPPSKERLVSAIHAEFDDQVPESFIQPILTALLSASEDIDYSNVFGDLHAGMGKGRPLVGNVYLHVDCGETIY
jgi:hypothetical protein